MGCEWSISEGTYVNKRVFARISKDIAARLVAMKPEWVDFLQEDGGLLVELQKAWYGITAAPALWHKEFGETLREQ